MPPRTRTKETPAAVESDADTAATPDTDAAPKADSSGVTRRKQLDPASVVITEVKPSEGPNPFARGTRDVPDDHPVVRAFDLSWEKKSVLFLGTEDPTSLVKLLRKIAAQRDLGVRVAAVDGGVHFEAKTKRARKSPEPAAE